MVAGENDWHITTTAAQV